MKYIMGLQKCGLNVNRVSRELQPHGTYDFPCAGYASLHTNRPEDSIPWHWHEEIEIVTIKKGSLQVQIPGTTFYMKKGDCLAINSNILHYASTDTYVELQSLVFHSSLIAGNNDSIFAHKYIHPLLSCCSFQGYLWHSDENIEVVDFFYCAFDALSQDIPDFEFIVREKLSKICLLLYHQYEKEIGFGNTRLNLDSIRIEKMLDFIHCNYSDNLNLTNIAKIADIGERECLRCFKRTIQLSPIQYLLKYRIMHGAKLLVETPSNSISEIATMCGFDSPSNFSKMFRRFYNCTPREYQNIHVV